MDPYTGQMSSIRRSNRKRKMKVFDDYEVDFTVHAITSQVDLSNAASDLEQTNESVLDSDKEQTPDVYDGTSRERTVNRKKLKQTNKGRKKRITENLQKSKPQPDDNNSNLEVEHSAGDKSDIEYAGETDSITTFLYKCVTNGCSRQFKTTKRLQEHKKQYHRESVRFICACCEKSFSSLYTARSHLRIEHSNTLAVEFTFQNTQVMIVNKTGIVEGNLMVCTKCGFSFSGQEVPDHDCVPKELQYYCPCCDFHTKVDEDMQQHLVVTDNHNGEIIAIKNMDKYEGLRSSAREPGLTVDQNITLCELCGTEFSSNTELKLHLNMKHAYLPFTCGVCKTCYGRKAALKNHMMTHTKPSLKCHICGKEFYDKSRLEVHVAIHSGDKKHQCEICGNRYCDERSVKKHIMLKHEGVTPLTALNKKMTSPCVCHLCGKTYQSATALNKHLKLHRTTKQFNCPICDMSFKEFKQFREHKLGHQALDFSELGGIKKVSSQTMQEIFQALKVCEEGHASGLPHKCTLCNRRFHTEKRLHGHIRVIHMRSEDKSFICNICNKGFTSGAALRTHFRLHDNTKPYRCRICHKRFRQLGHIKDHLHHHGKANVQCALCKKLLKSRGTLRRHVAIHCKIFPLKCPVKNCKESFPSLPLILDHFEKCSSSLPKDTPLKCNLCDQFFIKALMAAHFHAHETDLNFPCSCGMSFTTYHKLYFHKEKLNHFEPSEFESPGNNNSLDRLEHIVEGMDREQLLQQFDYIEDGDEVMNESDAIGVNNVDTDAYVSKDRGIVNTDDGELLCIAEQLTNMASGVIIQTTDPDMNGEVMEISIEEVDLDNQTEESQINEVILTQDNNNHELTDHGPLNNSNVESVGVEVSANEQSIDTEKDDCMIYIQDGILEDTTTNNIKHKIDIGQSVENSINKPVSSDKQIQEEGEDRNDARNEMKLVENKDINQSLKQNCTLQDLPKEMQANKCEGQKSIEKQILVNGIDDRGLIIYRKPSNVNNFTAHKIEEITGQADNVKSEDLPAQCDEDPVVLPEHSYSTGTTDRILDTDLQKTEVDVRELTDGHFNESFKESSRTLDKQNSKDSNHYGKLETALSGRHIGKNRTKAEIKVESDDCNTTFIDKSSVSEQGCINSDLEHDSDKDFGLDTNKRKARHNPKVKKNQSITREYSTNKSSPQLKRHFIQRKIVYQCTTKNCSKKLLTMGKMQKHKKVFHKENMKHICTICDKEFGTFYVFKSHIRMEHSELDFIRFAVKNVEVKIKEQSAAVGKGIQVCTKCGYRCGDLEHTAHSCTRMELLYYCPCLEFTTDSRNEIEKHIAENHQGAFRDISNEDKWASLRSVKREPEYKVDKLATSCQSCELAFNTHKEYKQHLNSKHADHPFACGLCYTCYGRKSAMVKHMLGHKKEYKCSKCNKGFFEKARLDVHMLTHSGQRPSQCELCGNRYCEEKNLRKHVMLKHPDYFKTYWPNARISTGHVRKVSSAVCHICGTLFSNQTNLKTHMKKQHTDAYKCPNCGESFNEIVKFKKHKLSHQTIDLSNTRDQSTIKEVRIYEEDHPSGLSFKCGLCEKRFAKLDRVQRHLRVIHLKSEDKKFVCQICNSGFVLKAALRTHMRLHNNSKPYRCRICQKHFRQLGHIKDHLLHHGKPRLQCALCIKKFKSKGNLNRHIQIHCKIFPFKCPNTNCSAAFPNLFSFLSHSSSCLESVQPEQVLTCNFCNKSFKSENILPHYHTHENDVKYPCIVCNMSFESYKGLYFHKEKHHHFEDSEYDRHCNTKMTGDKNDVHADGQTRPGEEMSREELLRQYDYLGEDGKDLPDESAELVAVENEVPDVENREIVLTEEQLSEVSSGVVYAEDVVQGALLDDAQDVVEIKLNEDVQSLVEGDIVNAQVIINSLGEMTGDNQMYSVTKPGSEDVTYYILQLDQTDT